MREFDIARAAPQDGILILSGYGIRVAVERGHLMVQDGLADERRAGRFTKIDASLKRLVIIGSAGLVTLDAMCWLHDVGVPLIHLRGDGTLLWVAAPSATQTPALRRNQALARETGIAGRIAEDLIRRKVEGQLALLDRLPPTPDAKPTLRSVLDQLAKAATLEDIRKLEGIAARTYWPAWRSVPVRFTPADRRRRPDYWQRFGTRQSPLYRSNGPRKAVTPGNAILNYVYAILEAEARIAALAVGADPLLGMLHTDLRTRDSLACDLMEPVRPRVDAYVLDLLGSREFQKEDFFETGEGQCRLMPSLTGELIQTGPRWARAVLPEAQKVAATLLEMDGDVGRSSQQLGDGRRSYTSPVGGRGVSTRPRRGQQVVMREHRGPTAIQRGEVSDPRRSPEARAKCRATMTGVRRANARWDRMSGRTDPATFRREILPKIQALPLRVLMEATGLTKGACSRMRAGRTVPHPRHWEALTRTL